MNKHTQVKTPPHHRLTEGDVVRDYHSGLLTARGAIFYLVCATNRLGRAVRLTVDAVCQKLRIHRATFYRAIADLLQQNRLTIQEAGIISFRVPVSTVSEVPDFVLIDDLSQECDEISQPCDKSLQKRDRLSHERDSSDLAKSLPEGSYKGFQEAPLSTLSTLSPTTAHSSHPVVEQVEDELGVELNADQERQIEQFTEEEIRTAIAVVKSCQGVKDRKKLFFKALRTGMRVELPPAQASSDFLEWFESARGSGRVVASQRVGTQILVLLTDDRWIDWRSARLELEASS